MTAGPGHLHDVPSAIELVEAVREFLESSVLPGATGMTKLHTRVAMNALAVVERELTVGGEDVRAHLERLSALGYADDWALALAIRSGAEDHRYDEIKAAVRTDVEAKLRVANPAYLQEEK